MEVHDKIAEAFPLYWPAGRGRTPRFQREAAKFDVSFSRARDNVVAEVQRLVGRYNDPAMILSTNIALRRDGLPLAGQRVPDDPGVAIYFTRKRRQMSFACDRWERVEHNMQAIAKTIEALRGIERWGTGDMLEAAFTGFLALTSSGPRWWTVFEVDQNERNDTVQDVYRRMRGRGTNAEQARVNVAWDEFKKERGLP